MTIKTESDYERAIARLEMVFDAPKSTKEGVEAGLLIEAISDYEDLYHCI